MGKLGVLHRDGHNKKPNKTITESMFQLAATCIKDLTLIIGIFKIITKYGFLANEIYLRCQA